MPTVLITGANRGIGLTLARQYAADGWKVLATCRDPARAGALNAIDGDVHPLGLAVTDESSVASLSEALRHEKIDVLFNNAGVAGREAGTFGSIDAEVWMETLRINTVAPIKMAEAFIEQVAASDQKKMAFVTSQLGSIELNTAGGRYGYNSSKAALNMAAKSLSVDLASQGIAIVLLHPGHVRTDMGGPTAPVTPEESAAGMRRVVAGFAAKDSGAFRNYDGSPIPW